MNNNNEEYVTWAFKNTRMNDNIIPYFFSKINIKFIQQSTVEYIYKLKNINIKTNQDINLLLNLMLTSYMLYNKSRGCYNNCTNANILGKLNKYTIERYVKDVLAGLNMHQYYLNDICQLPIPLSHPTLCSNKGSNVLGYMGPFENNHAFTKNIDSFNMRNLIPN